MNPPSTKQECNMDDTFFEPVTKKLNYCQLRRWSVKLYYLGFEGNRKDLHQKTQNNIHYPAKTIAGWQERDQDVFKEDAALWRVISQFKFLLQGFSFWWPKSISLLLKTSNYTLCNSSGWFQHKAEARAPSKMGNKGVNLPLYFHS